MRKAFLSSLIISSLAGHAQDVIRDTTLQEVVIQAYRAGRPLNEVAASIGTVSEAELARFSNTSILPAVNAIPGVRMEERSPGSYRFSMRGSLLRSPFGVRNVKMYWNGLPLTDGGGNTYLNLLDFSSIGFIEAIKGPAGSLYGAGTGGVVLLSSPAVRNDLVQLSATVGSYGLQRYHVATQLHDEKVNVRLQYAIQKSDGFREQTEMKRHAINADVTVLLNQKSTLTATLFYSDLYYETPGGLTLAQYEADPRQARPAGGPNAGSVEQQASIRNKTPYAGLIYDFEWNEQWSSRMGVFGSYSDFENPAIRNFEEREEINLGARNENVLKFGNARQHKLTAGWEYQAFDSPILVSGNRLGRRDTVQTDDEVSSRQFLLFAQTEVTLPSSFFLAVGASLNLLRYTYDRLEPAPFLSHKKDFDEVFLPRIALLKKLTKNISVYGNISRGFSPPSIAEVRPSTNTFNNALQAERGTNIELGAKGSALKGKLSFDLTGYRLHLHETIVPRHLPDGAEYFVNTGETNQRGIEALVSWNIVNRNSGSPPQMRIWNSFAYNHYRFAEYASADGVDFSGNKLTGIPPTVNSTGLDVSITRFYLNITGYYVDHVPLNDGNEFFAEEYFLLGARIGYKAPLRSHRMEIFAGVDNALDKTYSLGNDLNAIGGRFYNVAPDRNFYFGFRMDILSK